MREIGKLAEEVHEKAGRYFRGDVNIPGYSGRVRLVPAKQFSDRSPCFNVEGMHPATGEIFDLGVAWWKRSDRGQVHLSVQLGGRPGIDVVNCRAFLRDDGQRQDAPAQTGRRADLSAEQADKELKPKAGRPWRIMYRPPMPRAVPAGRPAAPGFDDEIPF
jgi:uncharacterized protein (DUF736 family)